MITKTTTTTTDVSTEDRRNVQWIKDNEGRDIRLTTGLVDWQQQRSVDFPWNEFNEDDWTAMLWAVWHEWPSGAQFTLNCY